MNIPEFRADHTKPLEKAASQRIGSASPESTASGDLADTVELSSFSEALLGSLERNAKVEALRSSYESGAYRVDPEALAKSLVAAHLALPDQAQPHEAASKPEDGTSPATGARGSSSEPGSI